MNLPPELARAALHLGAELVPWPFGPLSARRVAILGAPFDEPPVIAALFLEIRWPEGFFRLPDDDASAVRLRHVEQRRAVGGRAFATFALDVVGERTFSLAFDDPALEVYASDGHGDPAPTGQGLVAWLSALAPTDPPESDSTAWTGELARALRRGDHADAEAIIARVGARARHPLLGTTPLHHVALAGSLALFDALLAAGAALEAATMQDGDTPFVYAAWGAQPAILDRCLALHGVPGARTLSRALEHALMFDKVVPEDAPPERDPAAVGARLLAIGADPTSPLDEPPGETLAARLFAKAAHSPRMDGLVDVFLRHGVDPEARGEHSPRPLLAALEGGRFDLAERLREAGGALTHPEDRTTVVHALVRAAASEPELERWLARGADLEALDANGRSALELAVEAGRLEPVNALVARGARLDRLDADGRNLRTLAALAGATDVASRLAEAGVPEQPEHAPAIDAVRAREATPAGRAGTITSGAFAGMRGHATVLDDGRLRAVVSVFGQDTPVEIDAGAFAFDE
ncbi:MAG: hypothetical protein R3B82_15850 [Sandaracinaceae bacterium]